MQGGQSGIRTWGLWTEGTDPTIELPRPAYLAYSHLFVYSHWLSVVDKLFQRALLQAGILADNVIYALLRLAENRTMNLIKPAEIQNNYGLCV